MSIVSLLGTERAAHGFFEVLVDGKHDQGAIKRRGYELLVADDEDRIQLGKLGEAGAEQRRAPPRPQVRFPIHLCVIFNR